MTKHLLPGTIAICIMFLFFLPALLNADEVTVISPESIPRGDFRPVADLPVSGSALQLLRDMDSDLRASMTERGEVIVQHEGEFVPRLVPSRGNRQQNIETIRQTHESSGNNFALEVLMLMDIPQSAANLGSDEAIDLHMINSLHRISTLAGLSYFSASRGRMREFYLSSSLVADDGETPLPDPFFESIPDHYEFTIRQEDASFGDNLYRVTSGPDSISLRNINPMYYHFLRIAGPEDLEIHIQLTRQGDQVLFYAFSSLKAPAIFGIRGRLSDSFYNRIIALYSWYYEQLALTEI